MRRRRAGLFVVLVALTGMLGLVAVRERWLEPGAPQAVYLDAVDGGPRSAPTPSPGCGLPAPDAPTATVTASGVRRSFEVALPTSYQPSRPYPLILAFHGSGWRGSDFRGQLRISEGRSESALILYPDAVVRRIWGDEHATHWGKTEDLPFFDALVAWAEAHACVDTTRIFVVGWSSGGYFANQLACVRPEIVRAAVALSGGGPEDATCTRPVPLLIHHGRDDHSVPVSEGRKSRELWRTTNGCTHEVPPVAGCARFEGCKAPLVYCETDHTGHGMPRSLHAAIWTFLDGF